MANEIDLGFFGVQDGPPPLPIDALRASGMALSASGIHVWIADTGFEGIAITPDADQYTFTPEPPVEEVVSDIDGLAARRAGFTETEISSGISTLKRTPLATSHLVTATTYISGLLDLGPDVRAIEVSTSPDLRYAGPGLDPSQVTIIGGLVLLSQLAYAYARYAKGPQPVSTMLEKDLLVAGFSQEAVYGLRATWSGIGLPEVRSPDVRGGVPADSITHLGQYGHLAKIVLDYAEPKPVILSNIQSRLRLTELAITGSYFNLIAASLGIGSTPEAQE